MERKKSINKLTWDLEIILYTMDQYSLHLDECFPLKACPPGGAETIFPNSRLNQGSKLDITFKIEKFS